MAVFSCSPAKLSWCVCGGDVKKEKEKKKEKREKKNQPHPQQNERHV